MATLKIQQARWQTPPPESETSGSSAVWVTEPGAEFIQALNTRGVEGKVRVGELQDIENVWITGVEQVRRCDIVDLSQMHSWPDGSWEAFTSYVDGERQPGYLLQVDITGRSEPRWLLVDKAWLLGDDGSTIERIAP